jgi:hypothetical protein
VVSYAPPSHATALLTDPSLDYAFIGLQNGEWARCTSYECLC